MNTVEIEQLAGIIRSLTASGRTILLVEHTMALVMNICDRVTVLNFGCLLAEGPPDAIARDPAVIAAYLGAEE
jgi:branched-chain amino acid transport system ATP-binding protein